MSPLLPARLQILESQLTERDEHILHLVSRFRLLSGHQLQQVVFGESRYRSTRRALARLTDLGLVSTLARRIGGVRAGSAGYVYCLAPDGQRIVAALDGREIGRATRLREPSARMVEHTLAIGDVYMALTKLTNARALSLEAFDPEPSSWRSYATPYGGSRALKPDAFVQVASGSWDYFWFVEVDRSTESVATLARKIAQYLEYWRTGREQGRISTFPQVAWLTNTERQLERLRELFAGLPPEQSRLFRAGLSGEENELFAPRGES